MDVFIPEEYVTRRRLEKKAAAAAAVSKSNSHRNSSNRTEATKNKASSPDNAFFLSNSKGGFGPAGGDNVVFTCFSA